MPWYRFELVGGKGHPHEEVAYKFSCERRGKVIKVIRLPRQSRDQMIIDELKKIEQASSTISRLLNCRLEEE